MKVSKFFGAIAAASALVCGSASAVTVAGVTWNENALTDFASVGDVVEVTASTVGSTINGYGIIGLINGGGNFCTASGCELTYKFGGFSLLDINPVDSDSDGNSFNDVGSLGFNGANFAFTGGWINVYVDYTPDFDYTVGSAGGDTLFLSLAAIAQPGATLQTLIGTLTNLNVATLAGSGNSYMDVVYSGDARNPETAALNEGVANKNFDTNNAQSQCLFTGGTYCPDMFFNSSFAVSPNIVALTGGAYTHLGSADIKGNSVPEPGALALLGLGLAGLGFARRNKKQA